MGNYATVADIRAEGAPGEISDSLINMRIVKWEAIVERITGQVYRVIDPGEITFDGNNSDTLHFNLPLVAVTSLKINDQTTVLDQSEYMAFNGRTAVRDDRRNPKIVLTGNRSMSLYARRHSLFYRGMNQVIDATWGYVDDDPDNPGGYICPPPIKDAVAQLVVLELNGYFDTGGGTAVNPVTNLRRERSDAHEVEYQLVRDVRITWSMIPKHIADTLALYRGPIQVTSPDNRLFAGDYDAITPMVL